MRYIFHHDINFFEPQPSRISMETFVARKNPYVVLYGVFQELKCNLQLAFAVNEIFTRKQNIIN